MTAAVKKIIRSIDEHPDQWEIDSGAYTLTHIASKLTVWIANGFWFYRVYRPEEIHFNLADKARFACALMRWQSYRPAPKPKPTLDDCAALLDQVEAR